MAVKLEATLKKKTSNFIVYEVPKDNKYGILMPSIYIPKDDKKKPKKKLFIRLAYKE